MQARIILIDDDEAILRVTKLTLEKNGYQVVTATNGLDGLRLAKSKIPDLVLLDIMMPDMDGWEVCRRLRSELQTSHLPIIFLTAKGGISDKVSGFSAGAYDYITKPFKNKELVARIESVLQRSQADLAANPVSKLPGNISIRQEINKRIITKEIFAVGYVDLDNFKAFNDKFGFYRGDEVLGMTAEILTNALREKGTANDFLGHIGGDDFIFVTTINSINNVCNHIISNFDREIPNFYNQEDRDRGFIEVKDRLGLIMKVPLMSVSIAVVTNEKKAISHPAQISESAAELKGFLKSMPESNYKIDQRITKQPDWIGEKTIIIADASRSFAKSLHDSLHTKGYRVKIANNGAIALLMCSELSPDIVITSRELSLVDGVTLSRLLKENPNSQNTKIVLALSKDDRKKKTDEDDSLAASDIVICEHGDVAGIVFEVEKLLEN